MTYDVDLSRIMRAGSAMRGGSMPTALLSSSCTESTFEAWLSRAQPRLPLTLAWPRARRHGQLSAGELVLLLSSPSFSSPRRRRLCLPRLVSAVVNPAAAGRHASSAGGGTP